MYLANPTQELRVQDKPMYLSHPAQELRVTESRYANVAKSSDNTRRWTILRNLRQRFGRKQQTR